MFGIGKKKSNQALKSPQPQSTEEKDWDSLIHVMPKRFYVSPKKSRLGLILTIIIGILLIGGLAAFAVYIQLSINQGLDSGQLGDGDQQIVNVDINQEPIFEPPMPDPELIGDEPIVEPDPIVEPIVDVSPQVPRPLPLAADIDNDGLTLAEENLYGTDPTNPDTDGDSYLDGAELLSGYDPTRPGVSLADSGLFNSYTHPNYSIIYPAKWILRDQETDRSRVQFLSGGQEYIEVIRLENIDNLPLNQWYQREFNYIPFDQTSDFALGNLSGIIHPDKQRYYLVDSRNPGVLFGIIYHSQDVRSLNFMTTFNVMIKSFKLR